MWLLSAGCSGEHRKYCFVPVAVTMHKAYAMALGAAHE